MAGGKGKKKKWSKGKTKEKVNSFVLFDQPTFDKLMAEVPKYKMVTTSILADRLRLNGSLARKAIKLLVNEGKMCVMTATPARYFPSFLSYANVFANASRSCLVSLSAVAPCVCTLASKCIRARRRSHKFCNLPRNFRTIARCCLRQERAMPRAD